ncbi:hypothetical protein CPB86DRAFT_780878, partial [Serendipita vermifera]
MQQPSYDPKYTQGSGYAPGPSPYTSVYSGVTPALVYNQSELPSGTQSAGSGMPMWLQNNNNSSPQGRPYSIPSAYSPPNQNYVLPANWPQEGTHEGNVPVYPSNAVTFYGAGHPHAPARASQVVSEDSAITGDNGRGFN